MATFLGIAIGKTGEVTEPLVNNLLIIMGYNPADLLADLPAHVVPGDLRGQRQPGVAIGVGGRP